MSSSLADADQEIAKMIRETMNGISDNMVELCYMKYVTIFQGVVSWPLPWPKIEIAGCPWTYRKIKEGMYLMQQIERAKILLNSAVVPFLIEKNPEWKSLNEEESHPKEKKCVAEPKEEVCTEENLEEKADFKEKIDASDDRHDDSDESDDWIDISSSDEEDSEDNVLQIKCTCNFISLAQYLNEDPVALEHLKKMETTCVDAVNGNLYAIICNYRSVLEGYIYIAKAINMEDVADAVKVDILDKIPEAMEQFARMDDKEISQGEVANFSITIQNDIAKESESLTKMLEKPDDNV